MLFDCINCSIKGVREGEELKAPRYASAAATRDYITVRNIIPNNKGSSKLFYYTILFFSI